MKNVLKIVSLTLVFLMLLGSLAACKKDDETSANSDTQTGVVGAVSDVETSSDTALPDGWELDDEGYVKDSLPETYDFNGATFDILQWDHEQGEFIMQADSTTNTVNRAKYDSQLMVEKRFNVKLNVLVETGDWRNRNKFLEKVNASVSIAAGTYDMVSGYSSTAGTGANSGYYRAINDLPYLDFEKPWWPQHMMKTATIGEKVYYAAGDIIAESQIRFMNGMFVNLDMYEEHGIASMVEGRSIYEVVDDGDWTLETLTRMSLGTTGNDDDVYGIAWSNDTFMDSFLYSGGFSTVVTTNGTLTLNEKLSSGNMADWVTRCQVLFTETHADAKYDKEAFKQGRSLFGGDFLYLAETLAAEGTVNFSVLPVPKYDTDQEDFYTCMGMYSTLVSVPSDIRDPNMTGMIMEGLASQHHRDVKDVVYYDVFGARYASAEDAEGVRMFELLYNSATFDVGKVFENIGIWRSFRDAARGVTPNWSSAYASGVDGWKTNVDNLYAKLG